MTSTSRLFKSRTEKIAYIRSRIHNAPTNDLPNYWVLKFNEKEGKDEYICGEDFPEEALEKAISIGGHYLDLRALCNKVW